MNKKEFARALGIRLIRLPRQERRQSIDYYLEMIDDHMEDGLSEEAATAALGSVSDISGQILADAQLKTRPLRTWEIVLLAIGSPLWLSLGLAALAVLFALCLCGLALYLTLWAIVAACYAVDLALLAGVVAGISGAIHCVIVGLNAPAVLFFGAALVCAGGTVLLFFACNQLARGVALLAKWFWTHITAEIRGKEKQHEPL